MRTENQANLDRQILRILRGCRDYPLAETILRTQLETKLAPPAKTQEIDEALAYLESKRRIIADEGEASLLWALTGSGRIFCAENRIR